jgi:hypothetical protein
MKALHEIKIGKRWVSGLAVAAAVLTVVLLGGTSQGAPIANLYEDRPDIAAGFISVNYTTTGATNFTAAGFATSIDFDGVAPNDYLIGGTQIYSLSAHVTTAGVASSGALSIAGTVNGNAPQGSNDPLSSNLTSPLLTGTLSDFGYPTSGSGELQFIFDVTGGSAASLFGSKVGVKLNANGYNGTWASNFSNGGNGVADTFVTPEPATLAMLGVGGLLAVAGRKRRQRRAGR